MRFAIPAVLLAGACLLAGCDEAGSDPAALEGCVGSHECKFDRVCIARACVEPDEDDGDAGDSSESGLLESTGLGSESSSGGTTGGTSDGGSCECEDDSDCGGGVCLACVCVGDDSGSACVAPSCDACGVCEDCLTCAQDEGGRCRGATEACNANAECVALLSCVNACGGDSTCAQQCSADNPAGQSDYAALLDCVVGACAASCG